MKLWLISFILLLALVESSEWLKHMVLPLPMILLGGAMLAIVSNGTALFAQPHLSLTRMTSALTKKITHQ